MDLSKINKKIQALQKRESDQGFKEEEAKANPFEQFVHWFDDVLDSEEQDPTIMILATVDDNGSPDNRAVLLKELEDNQFIFYTNYASSKAKQLEKNNKVALTFYWPSCLRQVRIKGRAKKIPREKSEAYFATRPRGAQLGVQAWVQSAFVKNREEMDAQLKQVTEKFLGKPVPCPESWGGYAVLPFEYEFFQGRNWRMHDRLRYVMQDGKWKIIRLAP